MQIIQKIILNNKVLIFLTALILILFNLSLQLVSFLLKDFDYPINYLLFYKNILYCLATLIIVIVFKIREDILNLRNNLIAILIIYALLINIITLSSKLNFYVITIASILNISILILLFSKYLKNIIPCEKIILISRNEKLYYILILFSVAVVLCPILYSKNINYESSINHEIIKKYFPETDINKLIEIKVNNIDQINIINSRNSMLQGHGFYTTPQPYIIYSESDSDLNAIKVIFKPGRSDLSPVCLFIDFQSKEDELKLQACNAALGLNSNNNLINKINIIKNSLFINNDFKIIILKKLDINFTNPEVINQNINQIAEVMLIRGYFSHHYNSIMIGLRNLELTSYFWNQYGLGPLLLIKIISLLADTTYLDSIFISIFVSNILVFFILYFYYRNNKLIIYSFNVSILLTLLISNIFAPLLYYTRTLPYLLYIIFVCHAGHVNNQKSYRYNIINYLGLTVCALYNKEYTLIIFFALLISGLILNYKNHIKYALYLFVVFIFAAIAFTKPDIEGANFLALIVGVGFDGSIRPAFFMYFLMLSGLIYAAYNSINNENRHYLIFLFVSILGFSLKFITNPSANHLGWLLTLIAIFYFYCPRKNLNIIVYSYLIPSFCLILISLVGIRYSYFLNNFQNTNYLYIPWISKYFKIDDNFSQKFKDIDKYKNTNFCIISKQDDLISIYLNKNITSNMPNLSTNINHYVDVSNAIHSYSKCEFIIVDKDIRDFKATSYLILNVYNIDDRLNRFISGYLHDINKLRFFADSATLNRILIEENLSFSIYK